MNKKIGILDPFGLNKNPLNGESYSEEYKRLGKIWSMYPAYDKADEIIKTISDYQVILIISETGSGKTVLVPKFALHVFNYDGKIAVTLPKQLITKSTAEYAALTLDVKLGDQVGYQFKGESNKSDNTKLLYATDGTIVARLLKDPQLKDFDAVIVDEAHERKVQIDFLLYLLRNAIKTRPKFKLIIMSATINEKIFASYFKNFKYKSLMVSGRTNYPIESIFLKEFSSNEYINNGYETVLKIINREKNEAAQKPEQKRLSEISESEESESEINRRAAKRLQIIYNSPESEITKLSRALKALRPINRTNANIITLASSKDILFFVTSVNETKMVCNLLADSLPPNYECIEVYANMDKSKLIKTNLNVNRVIIATNVAESSITIEGIKYVIDSGFELFNHYDADIRAKVIEKRLISQAQAIQRKGRAGRTEPGICYHLYTKNMFENKMIKFPEPAIRTSNIYGECLGLLNLESIRTIDKLENVLLNFIEPPQKKYVTSAIEDLNNLQLVKNGKITALGEIVAKLQKDPMISISLIIGYNLYCVNELVAIFTVIDLCKGSISDLFITPKNMNLTLKQKFNNVKKHFAHKSGDHLSILKIFSEYRDLIKDKNNDKIIIKKWFQNHFLKKDLIEKSYKNYKKQKHNIIAILSAIPNLKEIVNLSQFKDFIDSNLETKLLLSLSYGFRINIKYVDDKVKINRHSFISGDFKNKKLFYNELVLSGGRLEMNIVSKITPSISSLLNKIE